MKQPKIFNGWLSIEHNESFGPLSADRESWLTLNGIVFNKKILKNIHRMFNCTIPFNDLFVSTFAGYIQQAENFYKNSLLLDYRSKPLTLYYCYLNLAKAYLFLNGKDYRSSIQTGIELHGVRPDRDKMKSTRFSLKSQSVIVERNGIARDLFDFDGSEVSSCKNINLLDLFNRITEISFQVNKVTNHTLKFLPGSIKIVGNKEAGDFWSVLAFPMTNKMDDKILKEFHKNFEKIEVKNNTSLASVFFSQNSFQVTNHQFYEARESLDPVSFSTILITWVDYLKKKIGKNVCETVVHDSSDFLLFLSLKNNEEFVSEFASIYLVTYYLSELVRYKPFQMNKIHSGNDRWIIESFVETTNVKMLRYFTNKITNESNILRIY